MDAATIENIAYELTKPHQQRLTGELVIDHRNQPGKQWCLYFFLGPSIAPTSPSSMAPLSASTILVVDDSLTMRQTLSLTLQKKGYRIAQARDGREALDQLQQEPGVRAVFCDIEMPQMNGFEFLSHCRWKFSSQSLPIIMLTSRSGEKHHQLAKQLGATDYLTKPYLEQELLKTLQNCLGQLTSLSS